MTKNSFVAELTFNREIDSSPLCPKKEDIELVLMHEL